MLIKLTTGGKNDSSSSTLNLDRENHYGPTECIRELDRALLEVVR